MERQLRELGFEVVYKENTTRDFGILNFRMPKSEPEKILTSGL
jgi:hypothetical protein